MLLDERAYQREPEARAGLGEHGIATDLLERPAEARQLVRGNADPGVAHAQARALAVVAQRHHDLPARRRELDRVREQIEQDLLERAAVGDERDRDDRPLDAQIEPAILE